MNFVPRPNSTTCTNAAQNTRLRNLKKVPTVKPLTPRKTPFRPHKRKQGHVVEVKDGGLLGFAVFKDVQVSLEEDAESEVPLDVQDLWVVPKRATRDADIGVVYGVGLEDEDEDIDIEDSDQPAEVANSSSSHLPNILAVVSTSSNPASHLVFTYDVDEAVVKVAQRSSIEWTHIEFKAICKRHDLSVKGKKGELMQHVRSHFQQVYQF